MLATNFMFLEDGVGLADLGYIICQFDESGGLEEISAGTPLSFKTVSRRKGNKFSLVDTGYDSALEITFDICKDPCVYDGEEMILTEQEYFDLQRLLLRKNFTEILFIPEDEDHVEKYYRGGFNVSRLMIGADIVGVRAVFTTDKPYAYGKGISLSHTFAANGTWNVKDTSCLTGMITPNLSITCLAAGTLTVTNTTNSTSMQVKNCAVNEVITIDGDNLIITSSNSSHDLYNDFNFEFLRIGNTLSDTDNVIRSSLACNVYLDYKLIIRDAP